MKAQSTTDAKESRNNRIFEVLAVLPSESTIHFVVFISLVILALLFVIATPAIALFFAEHHPWLGMAFLLINLGLFSWTFRYGFRSRTRVPVLSTLPQPSSKWLNQLKGIPGTRRLLAKVVGRNASYAPLRSGSRSDSFLTFVGQCWLTTTAPADKAPEVYWNYLDRRATARVFGRSRNPIVAITAGLLGLWPQKAEIARVYLLHEFGHIVNQDLEVFALTLSAARACILVMASSSLISAAYLLRYVDDSIFTGLLLLVSVMWLISLLFIWLFLARYAGVIVSLRELYADIRAVVWLQGIRAYEKVLAPNKGTVIRRLWQRTRSLLTMRLVHLSPGERLSSLQHSDSLLSPRHRYYILVALLLVALQSNPFGEGAENYWMRWPFIIAWAPIAYAYLLNVVRAILGLSLLGERRVWMLARLALFSSVILLLPMFRIPLLYSNLVLGLQGPQSIWGDWVDSAKTIAAQWGHITLIAVPILAFVWLALNASGLPKRMSVLSLQEAGPAISRQYRSFAAVLFVATLIEAILVGLNEYTGTGPFIDRIQLLISSRAVPPCMALAVLLVGTAWTRRAFRPAANIPSVGVHS